MVVWNLLEALPVPAYTVNGAGVITRYNAAAAAVWGRELTPNDPAERFCGAVRVYTPAGRPVPLDQCFMAKSLTTGVAQAGGEIVMERPDGTRRTVATHTSVTRDDAGDVTAGLNVFLDVSDRVEVAALRGQVDRLKEALGEALGGAAAPICSHCKQVRSGHGTWVPIEQYIRERVGEAVTHGICPACVTTHYPARG